MDNIFARYFVKNPAPIFQIQRMKTRQSRLLSVRCGNSGGFFWGRWLVTWRLPYSKVWVFDGQRWVPAYSMEVKHD